MNILSTSIIKIIISIIRFDFQFKSVAIAFSRNFTLGPTGGQFLLSEYSDRAGIFNDFTSFDHHATLNSFINIIGSLGYENGVHSNLGL